MPLRAQWPVRDSPSHTAALEDVVPYVISYRYHIVISCRYCTLQAFSKILPLPHCSFQGAIFFGHGDGPPDTLGVEVIATAIIWWWLAPWRWLVSGRQCFFLQRASRGRSGTVVWVVGCSSVGTSCFFSRPSTLLTQLFMISIGGGCPSDSAPFTAPPSPCPQRRNTNTNNHIRLVTLAEHSSDHGVLDTFKSALQP